jgi:hypothetical protein
MQHPSCDFRLNLLVGPIWMNVPDASGRQQPGRTAGGTYHGDPLGRRLGAKDLGHLVVDHVEMERAAMHGGIVAGGPAGEPRTACGHSAHKKPGREGG